MANHQAIVAKVSKTIPIQGADRIHVSVVLGEMCITSKETKEGDIGILFPAELQLSEVFCKENSLYRDATQNKDPAKTGYFDANRRIRAQPFLKTKSTALFMPTSSVAFTGKTEFDLGESFDTINDIKLCEKYYSQATKDALKRANRTKLPKKIETPFFEKHMDTAQFKYSVSQIPKGALLHFHSKKHGTSGITSHTLEKIQLPKWKQLVNKVVPVFSDEKWSILTSSRNVIIRGEREGFHGSDQFRLDITASLEPFMEKGLTLYYEIVGFVNGKPIMSPHDVSAIKNAAYTKKYGKTMIYKYGCAEHEYKIHVYRITTLDSRGVNVEFTQSQLEQWCEERNIPCTLEVSPPVIYDGNQENLIALVEELTERPDLLAEDHTDSSHVSEGIILRIDTGNLKPYFLKQKSFSFKVMEGIAEAVDTEDCA